MGEVSNDLKENFSKDNGIDMVKESLEKFIGFLDTNGFQIFHDSSKSLISNDKNPDNQQMVSNIIEGYHKKKLIKKKNVLCSRKIDKLDKINCENRLICNITKDSNSDSNFLVNLNSDMNINKNNHIFISNNIDSKINYKDNDNNINDNNLINENLSSNRHNKSNKNFNLVDFINKKNAIYMMDLEKNSQFDNIIFKNKVKLYLINNKTNVILIC